MTIGVYRIRNKLTQKVYIRKISEGNKGKKKSAEHRANLSIAQRARRAREQGLISIGDLFQVP